MAETDSYQGWKNYPTWNVHLWLANEEGMYNDASWMVAHAGDIRRAAAALRASVEEGNPLTEETSLYADILGWALERVDWDEVAAALAPDEWEETDDLDQSPDISLLPPTSGN